MSKKEAFYTPAPFFMVRKPTLPIADFFEMFEKIDEDFDRWVSFYEKTPLFKEAVRIASPSLFEALEKGERSKDALRSLLKYFIRSTSRSTPFGLFSSVSLGNWEEQKSPVAHQLQTRERPDMEWLSETIHEICTHPSFFPTLSIQQNPLLRKTKDRFSISYFYRTEEKKTVSIRRQPLTEAIFGLTQKPIIIASLIDQLITQLPNLEKLRVEEVIKTLLNQQLLWFSLSPSLLTTSPLQELLAKLTPEQKDFFVEKQKKQKLQIDAFEKGKTVSLPSLVAEEVAYAAEILAHLSFEEDLVGLSAYRNMFMEKYGTERLVPLLELLSEERGIGIPGVYKDMPKEKKQPPPEETAFRKFLRSEYARCLHEGRQEIELPKETKPLKIEEKLQPSLELYFEIIADSKAALERGDFLLLITNQTWQAGATFGRFLDLFEDSFHEEFKEFIQKEEKLDPSVKFIESSYLPASVHVQNVAIHPTFRKEAIDLTPSNKSTLSLDEIFVGSDHERLFLTSKDGREEFYVTAGNVVNSTYAPIPLRLLRDISKSKYRLISPFYWKELDDMPFLPRIRSGRIVLAAAQWNVDLKELAGASFIAWADRWKMPRYLYLTMGDQRLLLDRLSPLVLELIQRELKKGRPLKFTEKIGQEKGEWIEREGKNYAAEFVFPLLKTKPYPENTRKKKPYIAIASDERWKLPGSEWLFVKFYLPQESEALFLTQHFKRFVDFLEEQKIIKKWFFIRYKDESHHIRIRFYGDPKTLSATVLPILENWSSQAVEEGLIQKMALDSYEREIERYGGLDLIETVENLFCADSQTALALLELSDPLPNHALAALSILDLLLGTITERISFLAKRPIGQNELEEFRKWKIPLFTLAEAILSQKLSEVNPKLFKAFRLRKSALTQFYEQCKGEKRGLILDSLIHMHCNRFFGTDLNLEKRARAYAFHTLFSLEQKLQKTLI